jgi:hypothetical protein
MNYEQKKENITASRVSQNSSFNIHSRNEMGPEPSMVQCGFHYRWMKFTFLVLFMGHTTVYYYREHLEEFQIQPPRCPFDLFLISHLKFLGTFFFLSCLFK